MAINTTPAYVRDTQALDASADRRDDGTDSFVGRSAAHVRWAV
jgi:hypothetical protein